MDESINKTDHLSNYRGENTTGRNNTGLCALGLLVRRLERNRKSFDLPGVCQQAEPSCPGNSTWDTCCVSPGLPKSKHRNGIKYARITSGKVPMAENREESQGNHHMV